MHINYVITVNNLGSGSAFIENAHVQTQLVGIFEVSCGSAQIGGYKERMFFTKFYIRVVFLDCLDHLIDGEKIIEAGAGNRVGYSVVMDIEGRDVLYADVFKLPQRHGAVQRFPGDPSVLTAGIEKGRDHVDPGRLAADGRHGSFQVLKMFVRRHGYLLLVHLVGAGIIAYVHQYVHICSPNRLLQNGFCIAGGKANNLRINYVAFFFVVGLPQVILDLLGQLLRSVQRHQYDGD